MTGFIGDRCSAKNMVRLYATATLGITTGTKWIFNPPDQLDIDADNDGVMTPNHGALVDLSDLASQILGQQVPQSAKYKVHRIWMGLKNVDDVDDNDESTWFGGTIRWYPPTKHRLNALALARQVEKFDEGNQADADGFFLRDSNQYNALRFGWESNAEGGFGTDQVRYGTSEGITEVGGTEWALTEVFRIYNEMHPATKFDSLWGGRAGNMSCKIPWTVASATGVGAGDAPALRTDWNSGSISADVLAGLLFVNVADSSLDEQGAVDDDYYITFGVEFDVGVDA